MTKLSETEAVALFGNRFLTEAAPSKSFPEHGMRPVDAMRLVDEDLALEGDPQRNLATFVTTWMEPEAQRIIAENLHRNFIDHAEYPISAEIEQRCVRMLADLFNAPAGEATGCRTQGSSEAIMLGALSLKWKWKERQQAANRSTERPNLVFGGDVHVVWEKFCRYFDVEPRIVPLEENKYTIGPDDVEPHLDENTIGVAAVAVTGMASRRVWTTRCLVLAYTGAAVYLATRAAVTSEETADLDLVFSKQVLMAAVAVLAVLGVALLPFFRGVRTRWSAASLAEFGAAAALILGGGGAAIVIALLAGRSPAQLVIADGFDPPPDAVLLLALGGVLGAAVARTPLVRRLWSEPDERTRQGVISIALLALVALAVGIWSLADNLDAITARTWSCVAVVTTALAPIAGWSYLTRRKMIVARLPPRPDTRTRALGTQTLSRP